MHSLSATVRLAFLAIALCAVVIGIFLYCYSIEVNIGLFQAETAEYDSRTSMTIPGRSHSGDVYTYYNGTLST